MNCPTCGDDNYTADTGMFSVVLCRTCLTYFNERGYVATPAFTGTPPMEWDRAIRKWVARK